MRARFAIALAALAIVAAPGAASVVQPAAPGVASVIQPGAPAATDWTTRVERTAEGGYRMGNPAASLKLVEYGSIACSHCADFESEAGAGIREQVRTGRVSFEYRPHPIFPNDPGIFLLLECQPADLFFSTVGQLYATQASWVARLDAQEAQLKEEMERSFPAAIPSYVRVSGTDAVFRANGLTDQQIASCLADPAALARMGEAAKQAQRLGVRGTPTFFLNGRELDVRQFSEVVDALRQP